ncbi:DUF1831 domain-containing protein [Levilactobacillus bambusae]|uniref:Cysteine desulfurase n=1 Tax=Levilactobacillus bambusae TaxID=2024736 RepID=A0A2V1N428_9LACO|nr:DUF1831 domain-containing protein [Levilactobacillus bambusae]PWG00650.1 cysteine desulfurase [Levilactobacillus bambusae]
MLFKSEMTVKGDPNTYRLSPNIKAFALKDTGFTVTNAGNYQLERSVDPTSPYNRNFLLKVTVNKELTGFKMVTTTASGNNQVNIFTGDKGEEHAEQYHYIIQNLLDRDILSQVN